MCDLVIYQTSGNTYNKCFNPLKVNFALQGNVPNVPTCIYMYHYIVFRHILSFFLKGVQKPSPQKTNKQTREKRKCLHSFLIKMVCPYLVYPPPPPPPPPHLCTGLSYCTFSFFCFLPFFSLSFIFLSFFSVLHFCIFPILPFFFLSFFFDRLISISISKFICYYHWCIFHV